MSSLSKHENMTGSHMLTTHLTYLTELEAISVCLPVP